MSAASRPACEVVERYVTPRAARNKNLQWRLIVNQETSGNTSSREGAEYLRGVQVVRVGQCVRPGRRCAGAAQGPRYGQESECRQLYCTVLYCARSPSAGSCSWTRGWWPAAPTPAPSPQTPSASPPAAPAPSATPGGRGAGLGRLQAFVR